MPLLLCSYSNYSSLSFIVNLVSARSVAQDLQVVVNYTSYKTFDLNFFPGFPGMAVRLQQVATFMLAIDCDACCTNLAD